MSKLKVTCYWLSVISTGLISHSYGTSIAYVRPVHTALFALGLCSFLLSITYKVLPTLFVSPGGKDKYEALPLDDLSASIRQPRRPPWQKVFHTYDGRVRVSILAIATSVLVLRLELLRRVLGTVECTGTSFEIALPFLLGLYDAFKFQHAVRLDKGPPHDSLSKPYLQNLINNYLLRSEFRYIIVTFSVSAGAFLLLSLWSPLKSTYVCSMSPHFMSSIKWTQLLCVILDFGLAVIANEMLPHKDGSGLPPRRTAVLWSSTMTATIFIWMMTGFILFVVKPQWRPYVSLWDAPPKVSFFASVLWLSLLFSVFCVSTLHSILCYGIITMATSLTATSMAIPVLKFLLISRDPFPPQRSWLAIAGIGLITSGWWLCQKVNQNLDSAAQISSSTRKLVLLITLLFILIVLLKKSTVHFHPIDLLLYDAETNHRAYVESLGQKQSLRDTAVNYCTRYGRSPPPKFDTWFEYAMNKSCINLNEYDQIFRDLSPFYGLAPSIIRMRTLDAGLDSWNDIVRIVIRNGVARKAEDVAPVYYAKVESVTRMVNDFAAYLPDMDFALNLDDYPRVAAPYQEIKALSMKGGEQCQRGRDDFFSNPKEAWSMDIGPNNIKSVFKDCFSRDAFAAYGTVGCQSTSAAQSVRTSPQSSICLACTKPHSLGQFLSNWTLAADTCHQLDVANLHGFFASPSSFKVSNKVMPIFSASKFPGFSDILYPHDWDYAMMPDERSPNRRDSDPQMTSRAMANDVPFTQKKNSIYWRGDISGDPFSKSADQQSWRGMLPERLVRLANSPTNSAHEETTILLPDPAKPDKYSYETLPITALNSLGLVTDIAFVEPTIPCSEPGCLEQSREFRFVPNPDYEEKWSYRYLIDIDKSDGRPSENFISHLQSRSLPFRASLFREWYDSRLTAWHHFVPVDLRLHGFWSTLAYFTGVDGKVNGRQYIWKGHVVEAEAIAEAGRNWASQVLRKEDMEVYFFRLLLEWARVTDDNRDNLGFVIDE